MLDKAQYEADKLANVDIPELEYKIATMYDHWTHKNRTTSLQLDMTIGSQKYELKKLQKNNLFYEQQLDEIIEAYQALDADDMID